MLSRIEDVEFVGPDKDFDNTQACTEGWAIWECSGSDNGPLQICRIDCPDGYPEPDEPLASDDVAWAIVARKAVDGSPYHIAAIEFIRKHNPIEFEAFTRAHPSVLEVIDD